MQAFERQMNYIYSAFILVLDSMLYVPPSKRTFPTVAVAATTKVAAVKGWMFAIE